MFNCLVFDTGGLVQKLAEVCCPALQGVGFLRQKCAIQCSDRCHGTGGWSVDCSEAREQPDGVLVSVSLKFFCFSRPPGIFHLSCLRLSFAPHFLEAVVLCSAILVTESGCVSCFLLCQEAQNPLVVLVEPVLMPLSGVTKQKLSSVVDCISE